MRLIYSFFFLCRGTLDLNLKHAAIEKKSNHDIHARKMREKERDLKYVHPTNEPVFYLFSGTLGLFSLCKIPHFEKKKKDNINITIDH